MYRKLLILIFSFILYFLCSISIYAQNKDTSKINISTDIVSRYIWRGIEFGKTPSIQPTLSYVKGNFEIGAWGAFNTIGTYNELDPYAKYTLKNFTLTLTDYFIHNNANQNNTHYFNYDQWTTNHTFEGSLQYKGPEKLPISILVATYFYGNDRKVTIDSSNTNKIIKTTSQNYSTYIELGYTVKCKQKSFDVFLGLTPMSGAYGNTFGVVNAGVTCYRTIDITNKFSIPVKASLIANPQAENFFFVLGITI